LRKLSYDFLDNYDLDKTISIALRFSLSVPGVHTAIVGTKKPERWQENANMLAAGPLPENEFEAIRQRWDDVAPRIWVGQT
jgi:aryl-alcohol dehydrogenase-like predicted oxidoreductase